MTLYDVPVVLSLAPEVDTAKSVEMQCAIVNKDDFSWILDLTPVMNIDIQYTDRYLATDRGKLVAAEEAVVPGLLAPHLAGDGEAVVLAVLVVALDVEVCEVDGDPPLRRRDDLPDAVLVARVDVGEGGAAIGEGIDQSGVSTRPPTW